MVREHLSHIVLIVLLVQHAHKQLALCSRFREEAGRRKEKKIEYTRFST